MTSRPTIQSLAGVVALLATPWVAAQVVPFTSEHAARGVIYNMTLSPPFDQPQEGYGWGSPTSMGMTISISC